MWSSVCPIPGVRLYHTVTLLPGSGIVVFGGRSSPLNPIQGLCRITLEPACPCRLPSSENEDIVKLQVEPMAFTGDSPSARWRHTTTVVSHKGEIKYKKSVVLMYFIYLSSIYCSIFNKKLYNRMPLFFLKAKTSCLCLVERIPQQFLETVTS